jgi:hypothetical protein
LSPTNCVKWAHGGQFSNKSKQQGNKKAAATVRGSLNQEK